MRKIKRILIGHRDLSGRGLNQVSVPSVIVLNHLILVLSHDCFSEPGIVCLRALLNRTTDGLLENHGTFLAIILLGLRTALLYELFCLKS